MAVKYVADGQEDKNSILSNTSGSQAYEEFIAGMAWEVKEMKNKEKSLLEKQKSLALLEYKESSLKEDLGSKMTDLRENDQKLKEKYKEANLICVSNDLKQKIAQLQVPHFGPLFNEAIVDHRVLPGLFRTLALSAPRAKRSMLPIYQNYYEEIAKASLTIVHNHKESTTFEDFIAKVYIPVMGSSPWVMGCSVHLVSGGTSVYLAQTIY